MNILLMIKYDEPDYKDCFNGAFHETMTIFFQQKVPLAADKLTKP
jgi:hypothetical protein